MDTRRLWSFVKIIDTGSLTRAADLLHIAQPALSQQVASLEAHFKQRLLVRSQQGVTPTKAGQALYRHAQIILRQLDRAQFDVSRSAGDISGSVSVGLAPYSAGSTLALSLLMTVRERYPQILLHINESFGSAYSELIMTARMDMAVIHGAGPLKGLRFTPLLVEEFFLVAPRALPLPGNDSDPLPVEALAAVPLLLPPSWNFVRKAVEAAFARLHHAPMIVAEVESPSTLRAAVAAGVGCTILPWSVARQVMTPELSLIRRLSNPRIEDTVSLCVSEQMQGSEATQAVQRILLDLARDSAASGNWQHAFSDLTQPPHPPWQDSTKSDAS
jgi:LysR family nitrogen assimilation transcriptional regulator